MGTATKSKAKQVRFEYRGEPERDVYIAGTFNDWDSTRTRMEPNDDDPGLYVAMLHLPAGRHEYKFVVDGEWFTDPAREEEADNSFGSTNSVIEV